MKLTVLGSAASYPGAGRACAGHLVRADGATVLFDCGNGVVSNLGHTIMPSELDALFVTHAHIDHFADIYALHSALRFAVDGPCPPLKLYLPLGLFEVMATLFTSQGAADFVQAFEPHPLAHGVPVHVGGLKVTPMLVDHIDPTFALVAGDGDARLCYTADTRSGDAVHAAARESSLLLAEATLPPEMVNRARHMTAAEAACMARDAGAARLVLTHIWPTIDRSEAADLASEAFGGIVLVANEMDEFHID